MSHRIHTALVHATALSLLLAATHPVDAAELAFELLDADDATILLATANERFASGDWEHSLTASYSDYDLDFQPAPFDLFGEATRLSETTVALAFETRKAVSEHLWLDLGAGYRDGFPNFRSVWLDTYFDQHFSVLEGVPGAELYQDFKPKAFSANAGLRWEYVSANGFAQVSVAQIQDDVSPGYEIDFDGVRRSDLTLATTAIRISTENVLSERLRSRLVLGATKTSQRSWRYSVEASLNRAFGDRWIWRNRIGASEEDPQFEASFIETAWECAVSDSLSLYLDLRHYEDSGEIEDALLFTTAAPGLKSQRLGVGARYTGERWSARAYFAYSESDYDTTNPKNDFFQFLYRDRDWINIQLALGKSF